MRRAIGRMREELLLYRPGRASDGALGYNRNDSPVATLWARVQVVSGSEIFRYQHLEQQITHKVTIRYNAEVLQGMWFKWGNVPLYIEFVTAPDERNELIEVICRKGVNL